MEFIISFSVSLLMLVMAFYVLLILMVTNILMNHWKLVPPVIAKHTVLKCVVLLSA